ncbi:hypothetical protein [Ensifer adhaerens]|uniref:hypothetical protein n=1 Tax=Ensifer adhaerens TaxID=106592 RepID=UPI003F85B848
MARFVERFNYIEDESFFVRGGRAIGWAGSDGRLALSVVDRFNAQYFRRTADGQLYVDDPIAETGMEGLSLNDAIRLGFTTTEYQAALRVQMLCSAQIESEEELAAELLPPGSFSEAVDREHCLDDYDEWPPERPSERIPYPSEDWFAHEVAVGWPTSDGRLSKERPSDRFDRRWLVRDRLTGEVRFSASTVGEIGIESLSLVDAVMLGFSTVEYRTALRVRLFERRHLDGEADLLRSIYPPLKVQQAFARWGRIFADRQERDSDWGYHMWDTEGPIRNWIAGDDLDAPPFSPSRR